MRSTSKRVAVKQLTDEVWEVIRQYSKDYLNTELPEDFREYLEENTVIWPFDGGVFVMTGNEFDLFVVPRKRGRWNVVKTMKSFLEEMHKCHDELIVRIHERNGPSLKLAKFFGFVEVEKDDYGFIRMEHGR